MEFNDQLLATPNLEAAIARNPLIVKPETSLVQAIALMSQVRGSSCILNSEDLLPTERPYSSCVLVMENFQLLGILTERDIVRLTADEIDFEQVTVAEVMTQPVITLNQKNLQDIFAALFLFRRYHIRHLPIVDENNYLVGIISPETIRLAMRPANLLKLRRVADVMSKNVIHASTTDSVLKLAQLMAQHQVSCIVLTEEYEDENTLIPVGIVTERDIMQFQSLQLKLNFLTAEEVMSRPLFLLSPEDSLLVANQEMQRRRVRRLVVSWSWGQGLGIITETSLLKIFDPIEMYGVIQTLQNTIQQLQEEKTQLLALIKQQNS
jgi:CBS domain-containing protein